VKEEPQELQEPNPQPNLDSYYIIIEGGKITPQKFVIPLFFELEKERVRTHRWMQITKSKGAEDIGHMEKKLREMGRELSALRDREAITRSHLDNENEILRGSCMSKRPIWHTWLAYPWKYYNAEHQRNIMASI